MTLAERVYLQDIERDLIDSGMIQPPNIIVSMSVAEYRRLLNAQRWLRFILIILAAIVVFLFCGLAGYMMSSAYAINRTAQF